MKEPKPAPKPYRAGGKGRPPKTKQAQRALADHELVKAQARIERARKAIRESEEA